MDKDIKLYEIAYLISPALTEDEARDFHQKRKNDVLELGGLIDHEGEIKKRRLSYPIKKMTEAFLAYFRIMLSRDNAEKLKKSFEQENILRSLFVETKRNPVRVPRIKPATKPVAEETAAEKATTQEIKAADDAKIEEIDKKLEEILGA